MGTDVHGVFQRHNKETNQWLDIPSEYRQDRHYQLFSVLAGVRNGVGFAGVPTVEWVTPIAAPRGLPEDFVMTDEDAHPLSSLEHMDPRRAKWHEDGEPLVAWMGDHSHSWLTGEEMLAWFETAPDVSHVGILDRKAYEAWDGVSPPSSYCGGISGNKVVQICDSAIEKGTTPHWTHIQCTWRASLRDELGYFFNEVARLVKEHGEVRFVFGFDS